MRKFVGLLFAFVVLLGLLAGLCDRLWRSHVARRELSEPRVGSVSLGRWLLDNPYSVPDTAAQETLARAGGSAVPVLVRVAEQGLSPFELRFFLLWQNHLPPPLRKATARWITADPNRSAKAMLLLGSLGSEASNAVPALLRLARVDFMGTGQHARIALLNIAPQDPDVRALELAWLNSESIAASYFFREANCTYQEALPILLGAIRRNPAVAGNELQVLAQYGEAASNALPILRSILKNGQGDALSVLQAMGPPAAPAVAELAGKFGITEATDIQILDALRRIGPGAAVTLPEVGHYLTATNPLTRLLAEATVASLHGEPTAVLPSFQRTLEAHRPFSAEYDPHFPRLHDSVTYSLGPRQMACWIAGEMGSTAASILPSLEACFDDERELMRIMAAWGHWRIAHRADKVLPVLQAVLRIPNPPARELAIHVLSEIGPPAAAAEPDLQAIMTADLNTRRLVNLALTEIHRTQQPK